jgi:NADH:ubiquinone oxidoreductase subunit 5 (subunit L)/multisubunit Na+/H+ antiporter MnhA subunit
VAFVGKPVSAAQRFNNPKVEEVPWIMLIPLLALAAATVLLGLRLDWVITGVKLAVDTIGM